jgi:acyl carrier protein
VDDMTARICEFVREEILLDDSQTLDENTPLLGGVMDSLGLLQLVAFLEEQYEVEIDDADMVAEHFRTPAEISQFVQSKQTAAV